MSSSAKCISVNHTKVKKMRSIQPNTDQKLIKITGNVDVMAPFTYFITSFLHVEETELTLWSDKNKNGEGVAEGWGWGGILRQYLFFFFTCNIISHFISQRFFLSFLSFYVLPLHLSPGSFHLMICRTHIVYSVLD